MNLVALDFSNGNNATLSMRVIAERVRTGDVVITASKNPDGSITIEAREKITKGKNGNG